MIGPYALILLILWREGGIRTPDSLATISDFETGLAYIVIKHLADGWLLFALVGIVLLL
jgi:hypothetical protein